MLEALNAHKPVIYSDIPENTEIADGLGISFKNGDANDLSEKLSYALAHVDELQILKLKIAKKLAKEYDWDRIVDKYVDAYRVVAQQGAI